ncbi:MAG: hypothetical protein LBI71_03180 [Enterobacteriaceae bacterium]|jgi:hypothetical protein|nr:hypothetical protein [Enterobacteriaceae bacterium]
MIKKFIFVLLVSLSSGVSASDISTSVTCYTSGHYDGKKPINMKHVTLNLEKDNAELTYVKYEKSDSAIPIVFVKYEEIKRYPGSPIETMIWNEMIDGKVNGIYTFFLKSRSDGFDDYSEFSYKNNESGKRVYFSRIKKAYDEKTNDCIWK